MINLDSIVEGLNIDKIKMSKDKKEFDKIFKETFINSLGFGGLAADGSGDKFKKKLRKNLKNTNLQNKEKLVKKGYKIFAALTKEGVSGQSGSEKIEYNNKRIIIDYDVMNQEMIIKQYYLITTIKLNKFLEVKAELINFFTGKTVKIFGVSYNEDREFYEPQEKIIDSCGFSEEKINRVLNKL
ncbi:MAG: hypothetical protein ACOCP8_05960 [archaeon]